MGWDVLRTDRFANEFKKLKKNKEFCHALDQKIKKLMEEPHSVGGYLSGKLHGYKSMRILKNYRIVFRISQNE